ncbi:MAG: D-alanyl-D-alanine carboxypeptidase [Cyanobacteria bacterium J06627_8]
MFDWVGSLLITLWPYQSEVQPLTSTELSTWVQEATASTLLAPRSAPNQPLMAAVTGHIDELGSWGWPTTQQGIWFQSGRNVLAQHHGTEPFPAASLTKIATTLVTLDAWGLTHQFETNVSYQGTVSGGLLNGDLIIHGSGDPFFVWEEAIALGNALNEAGIQTVTGDLVIVGDFTMNFKESLEQSGALLRQGMNANQWPWEAQQQFATMPSNTRRPSVDIQGQVRVRGNTNQFARSQPDESTFNHQEPGLVVDAGASGIIISDGGDGNGGPEEGAIAQSSSLSNHLVRHRSVPLLEMLRQMNIYSNNFMADALANGVGGAEIVARRAAQITGVPASEIQLINGSGLGVENRISARAASTMLMSIQGILTPLDWSVADVFPVAGLDQGTIESRILPPYSAVKTGSLATVSALAGAIPTGDPEQDVVWFAIINWGSDLTIMRDEQDVLLQQFGRQPINDSAIARNTGQMSPEWVLGAPERNEILTRL